MLTEYDLHENVTGALKNGHSETSNSSNLMVPLAVKPKSYQALESYVHQLPVENDGYPQVLPLTEIKNNLSRLAKDKPNSSIFPRNKNY